MINKKDMNIFEKNRNKSVNIINKLKTNDNKNNKQLFINSLSKEVINKFSIREQKDKSFVKTVIDLYNEEQYISPNNIKEFNIKKIKSLNQYIFLFKMKKENYIIQLYVGENNINFYNKLTNDYWFRIIDMYVNNNIENW